MALESMPPVGVLARGVEGAAEACERVHDDQDVLAGLDHAPGALRDHRRHGDVVLDGLIVGGSEDAPRDRTPEVGHLFRTLVDEHREDLDVRMIPVDSLGDVLEQRRLARLGRRDDEASLAPPDRAEQVDEAAGRGAARVLKVEARGRVDRRKLIERLALGVGVGIEALDGEDLLDHRPGVARRAPATPPASAARLLIDDLYGHFLSGAQRVAFAQCHWHKRVIGVLYERVAELSNAPLRTLRPVKDAGQRRHIRTFMISDFGCGPLGTAAHTHAPAGDGPPSKLRPIGPASSARVKGEGESRALGYRVPRPADARSFDPPT
jgi:hypothetical protein